MDEVTVIDTEANVMDNNDRRSARARADHPDDDAEFVNEFTYLKPELTTLIPFALPG